MTPRFKIIVDGNDITNIIDDPDKKLLESLNISDKIGNTSDSCDITLIYDGSYRIPPTRGKVEVSIGYDLVIPRNEQIQYGIWKVGTYIVQGVNFTSSKTGKMLTVNATSMPESPDSAIQSLQNSNTRYWQSNAIDGTLFPDVVNEVANGAGLRANIHEDLLEIKMPFTAQINQTDAEFLTQISAIRDAKVKYHDDEIIITLKDKSELKEIIIDGAVHDIIDYGFSTSTRNDIQRVTVEYKVNNQVMTHSEGSGDPSYAIKNMQPDEETAINTAKTLLAHAQRSLATSTFSIATQPNLRAETPITLINFEEEEMNGEYICEEVRHQLNKSVGLLSNVTAKQRATS